MQEDALYPIMLRLAGRRCAVIGGGKVAERKVAALMEAGADRIDVIAEQVTDTLAELGHSSLVRIAQRPYEPADIQQAWLVIAATSDPVLNARIVSEADALGIWANSASEGGEGSFVTPAVVRRGDLVIGVTTSGASPSLAARLKLELEQQYGDEYGARLQSLRLVRDRLLSSDYVIRSETDQLAAKQHLLRAAAADETGWQELARVREDLTSTDIDIAKATDGWIDQLSKQLLLGGEACV
ncbi:bifunctional precorrin-2 dehydrogenase/sirohydrochlorin ferrochelatase [Paenibacillus sp. PR3]|uniref:precorrin-2 dehydrogenase n=1 Tax=Paenibacillus terricola TaxID=2763503 RepID=A0ABR8MRS2_9BACL|nr:bifunctional precorrin-2 dehydrogenase/sirohydrochlorin ferrochelatase [Paenibacillus terricola]MBD3917736.1 bifunctional precorrin-2 dehydrogenase/sirohydrochlorin ferrochelatase [Paenibacillus terricola]